MRITDVQGTKVFLAPQGTDVTTIAKIETALASAKQVNCLQTIGDVAATRTTTDYSCISSDNVVTSLGSITYADQQLDVLFDAEDITGKKDLIDAFENKERRQIIIVLSDKPNENVGSSPTYITYEAAISAQSYTFAKDSAVMVTSTLKPSGKKVFNRVTAP